jgi:heme/copper-type cytochrome/quinol oxidase subunit 3
LVSSGVRVMWAHHALVEGKFYQTKLGLGLTILLGVYFTFLQGWEYYEARFSFADRVFGSTLFYRHWVPWLTCDCGDFIFKGLLFPTFKF